MRAYSHGKKYQPTPQHGGHDDRDDSHEEPVAQRVRVVFVREIFERLYYAGHDDHGPQRQDGARDRQLLTQVPAAVLFPQALKNKSKTRNFHQPDSAAEEISRIRKRAIRTLIMFLDSERSIMKYLYVNLI